MSDDLIENEERNLARLFRHDKLYFDFFKHLTTLNSGAILILVAFIEKIFDCPKPTWLLITLLAFFALSLISSTLMMLFISYEWTKRPFQKKLSSRLKLFLDKTKRVSFWFSMGGFLLGFMLFIVFAFINF